MSANSLSGICWPAGVATRILPISSRIVPVLLLEAHDEIELLFLLHHLGGDVAADGRLDQAVDVGDVQSVTGDLGAVDLDGETGLSEFLHQGHIADSAHAFQDLLDGFALLLQRIQIGAEDLDGQGALQARFRLIHRVFRRLGVIEGDAGKCLELLVDGLDQAGLGAIGAGPLRVGLQIDVELDIEKAGGVRAVVGPGQFGGDRGDFGEGAQDVAHLGRDFCRLVEGDGVRHGRAHPQRAFIQLRHELGADARDEQQRKRQQKRRGERGPPGAREAEIEALGVGRFDGFESGIAPLAHALAHEPRAQHRQQGQRDDQGADQRENHGVRHGLEQRPGRPGQHIDRQEAGHDHRDGVEQRAIHLRRGLQDDLLDVERRCPCAPRSGGRCSRP